MLHHLKRNDCHDVQAGKSDVHEEEDEDDQTPPYVRGERIDHKRQEEENDEVRCIFLGFSPLEECSLDFVRAAGAA